MAVPPREQKGQSQRRCSCFYRMRAGVLVGIRSVYITPHQEEVMRLCCVNLCRAYRMPQLAWSLPAGCKPWTHTRTVWEEAHAHCVQLHTHTRRYSHACKHTYRPCLYPFLSLLSSLCCDVVYLLNRKNSPCWHIYKPVPNYAAVHSRCVCPFKLISPWNPSITASPPSRLSTYINFLQVFKEKPKRARCKRI